MNFCKKNLISDSTKYKSVNIYSKKSQNLHENVPKMLKTAQKFLETHRHS